MSRSSFNLNVFSINICYREGSHKQVCMRTSILTRRKRPRLKLLDQSVQGGKNGDSNKRKRNENGNGNKN